MKGPPLSASNAGMNFKPEDLTKKTTGPGNLMESGTPTVPGQMFEQSSESGSESSDSSARSNNNGQPNPLNLQSFSNPPNLGGMNNFGMN